MSSVGEAAPKVGRGQRMLRRIGLVVVVLALMLVVTAGGVYAKSRTRQTTVFTPAPSSFEIPTDVESVAEGERLFHARGCSDCHGADGGGTVVIDDPAMGLLVASNLTTFASAGAEAWSRAVRDGLRGDGTPLVFMPAAELNPMPDRELAAIVAYVRTMPPVSRELPAITPGPIGRLIDVLGAFPLFAAHDVDHARRPDDIPPTRNPAMGEFLARGCTGCHGAHLSGGAIPGAPPEDTGLPLNITFHETGLASWTEADFRASLREGRTPDGRHLSEDFMPWRTGFRFLNDDEIGALYDYLQTVPHRPEGER